MTTATQPSQQHETPVVAWRTVNRNMRRGSRGCDVNWSGGNSTDSSSSIPFGWPMSRDFSTSAPSGRWRSWLGWMVDSAHWSRNWNGTTLPKHQASTTSRSTQSIPSGGTKHPLLHLGDLLLEMGLNGAGKRLGYDSNGYLDINGYDGPLFSDIVADGVATVPARDIVDRLRAVKSEAELGFIKESCVWGNLAHRLMAEKIALGRNALDIGLQASTEASRMMIAALGPTYQPLTMESPAGASFSAGANTVKPHGLLHAAGLQRGDVLVTGAGADVGGYWSELERTMIIGEPTREFEHYFDLMMQLQQAGFDALRPGRTMAEVESDVSATFVALGVAALQSHHTGHGIGLEGHEWPFIDKGCPDVVVEENMVLSVEPGLYVPGMAGFRHSDTVVVRGNGVERLTFYPRDLASLIVPV